MLSLELTNLRQTASEWKAIWAEKRNEEIKKKQEEEIKNKEENLKQQEETKRELEQQKKVQMFCTIYKRNKLNVDKNGRQWSFSKVNTEEIRNSLNDKNVVEFYAKIYI